MVVDDVDKQVWSLMSDVPFVSKPISIITAFFNFVFPGIGTFIAACAGRETVSKA